jgi:transcriptional regulator with XRE-family HTH domain
MARSLQAQIWAAFEKANLTFDQLSEMAGLDLDRASMSRKLRGKQKMWTVECERIARVLGVEVSTGKAA